MARVNLETFAGGALQEKFDDAMEKVLRNMLDPNTPWKNKRKITVEVAFEQDEERGNRYQRDGICYPETGSSEAGKHQDGNRQGS